MSGHRIVTAVYGGTFDPIHNAHLQVARSVLDCGLAQEVWLMVSPQNPLKAGKSISPFPIRVEMARLAVSDVPGVEVSEFEAGLTVPSYTYKTLRELAVAYPDRDFRLLIGGDNLDSFLRWRNPEEILTRFGVIAYPRPGSGGDKSLPRGVTLLSGVDLSDVSSTRIRQLVAGGGDISDLVPHAVRDFIENRNLYRPSM